MKKLFTLAAAVLASFSLWAAETELFSSFANSTKADYFKTYTVDGQNVTAATPLSISSSSGDYFVNLNSTPSNNASNYVEVSVAGGYTIKSVSFALTGNGSDKECQPAILGWTGTISGNDVADYVNTSVTKTISAKGLANAEWFSYDVSGQDLTTIRLYRAVKGVKVAGADAQTYGNGQTVQLYGISIELAANCTDPELTVSPTEGTGFVGDPINIAVTSKNQSKPINPAVTVDGVPGVYGTDYTFSVSTGLVQATPLKAGTFVVTFTQASNGTYCDAKESATFVISEKTPVSAVTVDGPAAGFIGQELTYTATAVGATDYQWLVDGVDANTNAATFTYTAVKGNHSIVCKARNEFNAEDAWIASDPIALTVTKVCGELIAFTAETGSGNIDKDITATGVVGGTAHQKTDKNGKIGNNGYYVSLSLANGSFMAGDTVRVVSSTTYAKLHLFSDQGTNSIAEKATPANNDYVILDKGATTIYLYRNSTDGSNMNPTVVSMSVTRSCEESDNNNATVTINGEAAEKSGTVFNYTLSASYEEATVAVEIALEHPLATLMEDHAASFTMPTPEVGTPSVETFKVKAENGEQAWYSIFVNKSAELSHDATLKSLSVTGYTLSPEFAPSVKSYYITKAYGADDPATDKVVYEKNHANATAVVQAFEDALVVTVTAEDGTTHISYTINIETADAPKSLSKVLFSNGFDAFIDNTNHTVKAFYLSGTEAPTATTITAGAGTAGELADGKIIVTGADSKTCEYIVTLEAVTPNTDVVEESAEAGVFAGTEAWVKNGLLVYGNAAGFNGGKYVLRRQLKSGDAADDQRVIAGWVRAYFFVGNASKLELANTTKNVKVKYAVDGGAYTETEANPLVILLEEGNHMIEIVTNQSSGDCNLSAPKLVKRVPTALDNAEDGVKAQKFVENGQMYIQKDGKIYNVMGMEIR